MKACSRCGTSKPLKEFTRQKSSTDGFRANCKVCSRKTCSSWRNKNTEKVKENNKRFRATNPLYGAVAHESWCKKNHSKKRTYNIKRYWPGLTSKEAAIEYDKLLVTQHYSCAVCKKHQSKLKRNLCIDHCHKTGTVRGLLCSSCNICLGHIKDDATVLISFIAYLKSTGAESD